MVGENSSDGLAYKGMFWDATNTLSASFKHIYIYIYIYFVKTIIVLYILIWRFSDKYILIKIITKYPFIPLKNATNYY